MHTETMKTAMAMVIAGAMAFATATPVRAVPLVVGPNIMKAAANSAFTISHRGAYHGPSSGASAAARAAAAAARAHMGALQSHLRKVRDASQARQMKYSSARSAASSEINHSGPGW